jgi:hypothetical protein
MLVALLIIAALIVLVIERLRGDYIEYECDRCGETDTIDTWSSRKADRIIRAAGWTYDGDIALCPTDSKEK